MFAVESDSMTDIFKTYNKTLKKLIDLISNELPNEPLMTTVRRQYTAAITTDRTLLLAETGRELFVFRDYIADDRWDELISRDWEQSIDANNDQKSIQHMIMLLRRIWSKYDLDEKKYVQKLIKTLLSEYAKSLMR